MLVEAPGIEGLWKHVGFGGSRGVSNTKGWKSRAADEKRKKAKPVSIGVAAPDCSIEVSALRAELEAALKDLRAGKNGRAAHVLRFLLVAATEGDGLLPPTT